MPRAFGQLATSATTEVPIEATTYVEQTSGAQRSLKSSSVNDAAAGTGVRQVKITYYSLASDGTIAGPFTETVVLNGTTAVPTVATNIALIEKLEAVVAGSGGVAAGTISLYDDNAGAGSVFGSIAASDVRTRWAHHYVPTAMQCSIGDLTCIGGDAAAALVQLKVTRFPTAGVPEQALTEKIGSTATLPRGLQQLGLVVAGPARVRMTVTPANGNAQTTYAGFGYVDRAA